MSIGRYDIGDMVALEAAFTSDAVTVTTSGSALLAATSIPVEPLSGPIASGTTLTFDTPATATLTSDAAIGATSLTVSALAAPIGSGDIAEYAGGPVDPTTVTFIIQAAGQDATTYVYGTDPELVRDSEGVYSVAWTIVDPYTHQYRFEGTGACQQEQGGRFYARPRNV